MADNAWLVEQLEAAALEVDALRTQVSGYGWDEYVFLGGGRKATNAASLACLHAAFAHGRAGNQ